jgi:hypothetical protein
MFISGILSQMTFVIMSQRSETGKKEQHFPKEQKMLLLFCP